MCPKPLLSHYRQRSLGDDDRSEEVRFDLGTELGKACILNRADIAVTCIVDENIQPAEPVDRRLHGRCGRPLIGYIEGGRCQDAVAEAFLEILKLRRIARRCDQFVPRRQVPLQRAPRRAHENCL